MLCQIEPENPAITKGTQLDRLFNSLHYKCHSSIGRAITEDSPINNNSVAASNSSKLHAHHVLATTCT
eukprot:c36108_g1_i1 orf=295-498(+)